MPTSCSFRITRTAEDLANTVNAISNQLLKLEQSHKALALKLRKMEENPSQNYIQKLEEIDQILMGCSDLLEISGQNPCI